MKADGRQRHADTALSDEALEWLVKLHSGRASEADHAAFTRWRNRSPGHEEAALEAEAIWNGLGIAGSGLRDAHRQRVTRRAVLGGAAVAVSGAALYGSGIAGPHLFADHTTGIAGQRSIALPDGSTAFLNADTALSVDFTQARRGLRLFRGQATFTVAHDPARPFVVDAQGGHARAVGTVFDVDIRPREVAVTVLEGVVAISGPGQEASPLTAHADQRVRYGGTGISGPAESVDAEIETAWRRGKLIFNRRPLGDVVAEIGRYRSGSILVAGASLSALEVTGVFDLRDPDAVLQVMEQTLPIRITRLPFLTIIR